VRLGAMVYESLPETRVFLLGSLGIGAVIGLLLWWMHRQ
jgi:hypothetical protein